MFPDLSIIIPMRNQAAHIEAALDSIASQSMPLEVVVVDDCSSDGGSDVVKKWASAHAGINVRLEASTERLFAFQARLLGISLAQAPDIMFMDADDLLPRDFSLAGVIAKKVEAGAEIAHFHTMGIGADGENAGCLAWAAPFVVGACLSGHAIFRALCQRPYPPFTVWGKIYSRVLIDRILPLMRGIRILGLEDALFVTLAMLHCPKYLGLADYGYIYRVPARFPLQKLARRAQGWLTLLPFLSGSVAESGVDPETRRLFQNKFEDLASSDIGRFSIEVERELASGANPDDIFAGLSPYLTEDEFFAATLLGAASNAQKWLSILNILYKFE